MGFNSGFKGLILNCDLRRQDEIAERVAGTGEVEDRQYYPVSAGDK